MQECLKAAGEWETALSLAVCQADFAALRQLGSGLVGAEAGLLNEKDAQVGVEWASGQGGLVNNNNTCVWQGGGGGMPHES